MRILVDTNVLLWVAGASSRLDAQVRDMLQEPDNVLMFSTINIWEIAIKAELGRADFTAVPERIMAFARTSGFKELPVTAETSIAAARLPAYHRDPFDRMLVAQARAAAATLLTTDRQLARYTDLVTVIGRA